MISFFGEPIHVVSRQDLIDEGILVDVTEWASADKGFHGGFACPVSMTRRLWEALTPPPANHVESLRGRAHDVLFLARLALCRTKDGRQADYTVKVGRRNILLRATVDGDGVLIGYPGEDD
ncbi:MAG: DUF6573 family protein [Chloroflexota bacterium]